MILEIIRGSFLLNKDALFFLIVEWRQIRLPNFLYPMPTTYDRSTKTSDHLPKYTRRRITKQVLPHFHKRTIVNTFYAYVDVRFVRIGQGRIFTTRITTFFLHTRNTAFNTRPTNVIEKAKELRYACRTPYLRICQLYSQNYRRQSQSSKVYHFIHMNNFSLQNI